MVGRRLLVIVLVGSLGLILLSEFLFLGLGLGLEWSAVVDCCDSIKYGTYRATFSGMTAIRYCIIFSDMLTY